MQKKWVCRRVSSCREKGGVFNQPSIFWPSALGLEAGAISEEPNTLPPGAERFLAEVFAKRDLGLALG
tara:strand:- start:140 stop:343 length:204 start_codon:yes stop_codon:yes gene_type:complete